MRKDPPSLGSVSVRLRYSSSSSLDADADGKKKITGRPKNVQSKNISFDLFTFSFFPCASLAFDYFWALRSCVPASRPAGSITGAASFMPV
jgi:hypothetical protein